MYEDFEVILVDDCSSDPMPDKINEFIRRNQVVYVRHEENKGLADARNTAIKMASGRYFTFCDDDDVWPDSFAYNLLNAIKDSPKSVKMAMALVPECRSEWESFFNSYPKLTDIMRWGFTPPVSSQIYKTEILRDIGGYDSNIRSGVDHDLWISLALLEPRLAVVWCNRAVVGDNPHTARITTSVEHRKAKISEALRIWHPKISEAFGESFYQHFCQAYSQHLNFSFFMHSIKRKELFDAVKQLPNQGVAKKFIQLVYRKITGNQKLNSFSPYQYNQ